MSSSPVLPSHTSDLNGSSSTAYPEKAGMKSIVAPGDQVATKNHLIAMLGEFMGTTMFLFLALGGTSTVLQAANSVNNRAKDGAALTDSSNLLYIAFVFGFSLAASVFCFFRVSGGLFNPAVTLAFVLIRGITPLRGALLFVAQLAGALAGAGLADAITPGPLFAAATLGGGASIGRGFCIEMFMTCFLVFTILMMAVEKNRATFIAPLAIGLTFFCCEALSVYYTGGALNPVRAFAPCVVNRSFPGYHWLYWIAPLVGSCLAVACYLLLKYLKYETNLGPDADDDGRTYAYNNDVRTRLEKMEEMLLRINGTRLTEVQ